MSFSSLLPFGLYVAVPAAILYVTCFWTPDHSDSSPLDTFYLVNVPPSVWHHSLNPNPMFGTFHVDYWTIDFFLFWGEEGVMLKCQNSHLSLKIQSHFCLFISFWTLILISNKLAIPFSFSSSQHLDICQ